jgi:hypothetical protein
VVVKESLAGCDGALVRHRNAPDGMLLRQLERPFTDLLDAEADGNSVDRIEGYSPARGHRLRQRRGPESLDCNDGHVGPAVAMEPFDNPG